MIVFYILLLCFLPALLVFGFVKVFKKQLAADPTKQQIYRLVGVYIAGILALGIVLFGLSSLIS